MPGSWAGAAGGPGREAGIPEVPGCRGGQGRRPGGVSQGHGNAHSPASHPRGLPQTRDPLSPGAHQVCGGHITKGSGSSVAPTGTAGTAREGVGTQERRLTLSPVCVPDSGHQPVRKARISCFRHHPLVQQLWALMACGSAQSLKPKGSGPPQSPAPGQGLRSLSHCLLRRRGRQGGRRLMRKESDLLFRARTAPRALPRTPAALRGAVWAPRLAPEAAVAPILPRTYEAGGAAGQ